MPAKPGSRNLISDVKGVLVGSSGSKRVRSGVTVVLVKDCEGAVAGCDVGGGAPGTRETDALRPGNLVGRAHAVVLSGGSVFGLAAADAVTAELSASKVGLRLHEESPAVPIVPSAVIYDLANGGDKDWENRPPYGALGKKALKAAGESFTLGAAGAGLGATTGAGRGGLGSASLQFGRFTVGALVAVNAVGSPYMADGVTPWAWPLEINGEFGGRKPDVEKLPTVAEPLPPDSKIAGAVLPNASTMVAVVATDMALDTPECTRVARAAHDGFARAVRPSHTLMDGDTVFVLSTGRVKAGCERNADLARLESAAADCLSRAVVRGVYEASHG